MKTVLFIGDSVTDCGRRNDGEGLGAGYVRVIASILGEKYPELSFINTGISGNRVKDLQARWDEDCLAYSPDTVSILIGINNVWRKFDRNDQTPLPDFVSGYRDLLERTARRLPDARIILMEPFVLNHPDDRRAWRSDLDEYIAAVRGLAGEFGAELIPLDGIFAAAALKSGPARLAADGVHPTAAGHGLIARVWMEHYLS